MSDSSTSSAADFDEVTKSDTTVLQRTRGIYVGTGGDLAVKSIRGTTCIFANVPDGTLLPIRVLQVLSTGTDASDIVALY